MSDLPPVTFGIKVTRDDGPGGHVHFDIFAGRTPHSRGRAGSWVLRHEEFHAFLDRLRPEASYINIRWKIDTDWNGESLFLAVADGVVRMWRDGEEVELMLADRLGDRAAVALTDVQADGLATALASAAEIIRQERAAARRKARE